MKVRNLPHSLGDCIAYIVDLCNENEELKIRINKLELIKTKRTEIIANVFSKN